MGGEGITAIVLAAGRGSRMKSDIQKQYMLLEGRPVLYYSLHAFQEHRDIGQIILVTGEGETEYCRREIAERYRLDKVKKIVPGGRERYLSVYEGLCAAKESDYVLVHDGARPFLTETMISRCIEGARTYRACAAGMPVKDTIKISDEHQFAQMTPDRSRVWMIQTPQAFEYGLLKKSYDRMLQQEKVQVTDDAMVVEQYGSHSVKLIEGSYQNIKITTPEDLKIAAAFMEE